MTSWLKVKLGGKIRVSTAVLLVAFIALFWVYHNLEPTRAAPEAPAPAVVPPGFRARPQLHVGAAYQRATAQGA